MDKALDAIEHYYAVALFDVIYSKNCEDHVQHIADVLSYTESVGLTVSPEKVSVCKQTLKFLEQLISPDECCSDLDEVGAPSEFPHLTTVKKFQMFLGLAGYYQNSTPWF